MMADSNTASPWFALRERVLDVALVLVIGLTGTNVAVVAEVEHGIASPVLPLAALCIALVVSAHRERGQAWVSALIEVARRTKALGWVLLAMAGYASALAISSIGARRPSVALIAAQSWVSGMVIVTAVVLATSMGRLRLALWSAVGCIAIMAVPTTIQRVTGTWEFNWFGLADAVESSIPAGTRWRSEGSIESNAFGAWLVIFLPLVLAMARIEVGWQRRLAIAVGALGVVAVLSTYSRGALIGLVIVGVLGIHRFVRRPWVVMAAAAVTVTMLFPSIWADQFDNLSEVGGVVTGSINGSGSTAGHASTAAAGVLMFLDHPVNGVGARNFVDHYLEYVDRVGIDESGVSRSAHNSYVQVAAETGMFGVLILLAAGVSGFRALRSMSRNVVDVRESRTLRPIADALWLAFAGVLVTSIFTSTSHPQVIWILTALAVSTILAVGTSSSPAVSRRRRLTTTAGSVASEVRQGGMW